MKEKVREIIDNGVELLNQDKFREAEDEFNKALAMEPDNAVAHTNLGFIKLVLKDFRTGIDHLKKAIEKDSRIFQAYLNLGGAYMFLGELRDAEQTFPRSKRLSG